MRRADARETADPGAGARPKKEREAMRVAVLGDIHGNSIALEQVLADMATQEIDVIVGVGDYLNTSRGSARVVEWVRRQPAGGAYFIRGNSDAWRYYHRFRDAAREDAAEQYRF